VQPAVVATIDKPTRELLETLARDTVANLPPAVAPAFLNYQLATTFGLDDCSEPESRAQNAAFADARARAQRVAAAAGVKLGAVLSVNESFGFAPTPCRDWQATGSPGGGAYDSYGPLEVPITVGITVTFAII